MEEECLALIDESSLETLKSETFADVTRETVESVVKRDTLCAEEIDIYNACMTWAEAECKRKEMRVNYFTYLSKFIGQKCDL